MNPHRLKQYLPKRFFSIVVLTAITFIYVSAQDTCQRTSNKSTEAIEQRFPFNKAKHIKIVSFKPQNKDAVEYEIPKVDGQVDVTRLFEVKILNERQVAKLLDILININYVPLPDSANMVREIGAEKCYLPRHAILFENEHGKVYCYIEICFECLQYKTQPKKLNVGEFCSEKYTLLEDFFREANIVYV